MNEENKTPKNKWSRIFRKKWFFPALYLGLAAVLLAVVVWYQNMDTQVPTADEDVQDEEVSSDYPIPSGEDAEPVMDQQEVIQFPLNDPDQAEIVTKFYDYTASEEDQENALVFYNNRYYQSTGIDFASEEPFDVQASLSGTVSEVKEDPLLGNVVVLSHDNDVMTYYASLDEVAVTAGDEVKQGDQVGTAGNNIFGKENGTHVHFELRKDGKGVNPESYFNQPVSSLDEIADEEVAEESEANEDSASENEEAGAEEEADAEDDSEEPSEDVAPEETEESDEEDENDSEEE